jgi:amino acid permease
MDVAKNSTVAKIKIMSIMSVPSLAIFSMAVNRLFPMVPISQGTFIETSEFDEYG